MRAALPWAGAVVFLCVVTALAPTATWALIGCTIALSASALLAPKSIRNRLGPLLTVIFAITVVAGVRTFGSPL